MILVVDNYDSFTYNLVDLVQRFQEVKVVRNDRITLAEVKQDLPDGMLISPGPGKPLDSGMSVTLVKELHEHVPILGVCLGHQLIGELFGANVSHASRPMHGKTSMVQHHGKGLFEKLPNPLRVMRYHSLLVNRAGLPNELEITAETESGEIMALRHKRFPLWGVQFHPESILSDGGQQLIGNWVEAFAAKKEGR